MDVAEKHGKAARNAQPDLRRLSDMAIALYVTAAVIARVSSPEATPDEPELNVARLACRRLARQFQTAAAETENPDDEIIATVAKTMTA